MLAHRREVAGHVRQPPLRYSAGASVGVGVLGVLVSHVDGAVVPEGGGHLVKVLGVRGEGEEGEGEGEGER